MEAPVYIHHKQVGPQRRFQKILQNLASSNSSNSLHASHSSKQRLNIHEELIKNQIEQIKDGCNKFYIIQPHAPTKEVQNTQNITQNNTIEKAHQRNESLVKALQQQKGKSIVNEQQSHQDTLPDIQNLNISSSKQLLTNQSIPTLPLLTEHSVEKQFTNQDNSSYYDPDIGGKEQGGTLLKSQFGSHQKSKSIHKGSGGTLHDIVNKQLQAIRQSRKSLHKDLSFNTINQNSNSQDDQNPNLYLTSNTDNHNSSTNIFVKKDLSHADQVALNMQAYQIRVKEDKIPYYLQNQIPSYANVSNSINMINNSKVNYSNFKQELLQNSIKQQNHQLSGNHIEQYQPKYQQPFQNSPPALSGQKIYKRRNHSLNHGNTGNHHSSSQLQVDNNGNTNAEVNSSQLYSVEISAHNKQMSSIQGLTRSNARRDFSLDSKIQTYNVEENMPISKPTKDNSKRHTQKITVVRKFNITETTIHKIQKTECQCSFRKSTLDEDDNEDESEESSRRFLTARSKDNFKNENPVQKIILRSDSFDKELDKKSAKKDQQMENSPYGQADLGERMTKIKLIQNQGINSQRSPSHHYQNDYSSSEEKKNFKITRSNKKQNSVVLHTPQKVADKHQKTTLETQGESESENLLNSPSLPPILVCSQQEIYKKLYKVSKKKKKMDSSIDEDSQIKANAQKRLSYNIPVNSNKKAGNRSSQNYGNTQNQSGDNNALASHTHVQLNQQIIQQQPHSSLPQIQSIQANPIYQQNKYMPEIKEEVSQSSRQYYTDGRISSTYTGLEINNYTSNNNHTNNNNNSHSRLSKNFSPEEVQLKNQPELKVLVQELIKCICEFEIISSEETDPILESYLYNTFAQKTKLQNQMSLPSARDQLTSNTQALINTVKLLIKQPSFIQQYPFHKTKFDQIIVKCEKAINSSTSTDQS